MAKRKETIEIERALIDMTEKKRLYGCEEVTIGFYNNGHGDEIVDFINMNSKGIVKCYEIKVTYNDLKSKAKKSFYGHYNYLVITEELLEILKAKDEVTHHLKNGVGLLVYTPNCSWNHFKSIIKAKKQKISPDDEVMIKESMVRSMSYKIKNIRNFTDIDNYKTLQNLNKKLEKQNKEYKTELTDLNINLKHFGSMYSMLNDFGYGQRFDLEAENQRLERLVYDLLKTINISYLIDYLLHTGWHKDNDSTEYITIMTYSFVEMKNDYRVCIPTIIDEETYYIFCLAVNRIMQKEKINCIPLINKVNKYKSTRDNEEMKGD